MDVFSIIVAFIALIISFIALILQFSDYSSKKVNVQVDSIPVGQGTIWCNDIPFLHRHLKWLRIVNKSSLPITVYNMHVESYECSSTTYYQPDSAEESETFPFDDWDLVARLPIKIDEASAYEGFFIFWTPEYGVELTDGTYTLKLHTSRGEIIDHITVDTTERDL